MVVTVFGLGFVGLTTAVGFAEKGAKVFGYDVNKERVATISQGKLPFHEPGLDAALEKNLGTRFFITEDAAESVQQSDCVFFCVGTPYGEDGQADLRYLFSAIDSALDGLAGDNFKVFVTKSTVPPSTTKEKVVSYIESKGFTVGKDVGIANNPEFLREGYCWDDFIHADRIVLGVNDPKSTELLQKLYEPFAIPVHIVSWNTGEFIKYLSNTLLATLISYANEMSVIADSVGDIEIAKAFKILHEDKRWGNCSMTSYVYPGCGYGGYCLPKDTNALYHLAKMKGCAPRILENVIRTNDHMPQVMADRIAKCARKDDTIGVLGLSFKPESDDVRDTPAAKIISELIKCGYTKFVAYDPLANTEFDKLYGLNITYKNSMKEIIDEADVITILTAWKEFKRFESDKPVIDCRYVL